MAPAKRRRNDLSRTIKATVEEARRAELLGLTMNSIQLREEHWVILLAACILLPFEFIVDITGTTDWDAGKVFVLVLTAFAVGILVYLELKSRRSRHDHPPPPETDQPDQPEKPRGKD